jgi:hypothetical protein
MTISKSSDTVCKSTLFIVQSQRGEHTVLSPGGDLCSYSVSSAYDETVAGRQVSVPVRRADLSHPCSAALL